eukprot:m.32555 g.32555  ORF g.32555 m.32555 type:complete len:143 (-) comp15004_c0_seq1:270-698(-)
MVKQQKEQGGGFIDDDDVSSISGTSPNQSVRRRSGHHRLARSNTQSAFFQDEETLKKKRRPVRQTHQQLQKQAELVKKAKGGPAGAQGLPRNDRARTRPSGAQIVTKLNQKTNRHSMGSTDSNSGGPGWTYIPKDKLKQMKS